MEWVKLGDIIKINKGKKVEETLSKTGNSLRYIQIEDLRNNDNLKYTEDSKAVVVDERDILIAWDGANAGTVGFNLKGAIGSTISALRINKKNKNNFLSEFVGYFLKSKNHFLRVTATGATIPHINKAALLNIKIPLLSIDKQNKIVNLLKETENLINIRKEQIQAYDDLIESLFYKMFGNIHNSGFEITSIGSVIESTQYGTSGKAQDIFGNYKILRMGNLTKDGFLNLDDIKYIDIEKEDKDKYLVNNGDILFNRTNSKELVGKTALYNLDYPMAFAGYLIRVRVTKKINPLFLTRQMNQKFFKDTLYIKAKTAIGMANINAKELRNFKIIFPPIEMQNKFADYVIKIEGEKKKSRESLDEFEILFDALMEDAFSGNLFKE